MNADESAQQTREVYELFDQFTDEEITTLLKCVGVRPCADRGFKIHQCLVVWFHGSVPNLNIIPVLEEESRLRKK